MKIGVISDTHIPLRARYLPSIVFELFDGVDLILHAGDIVRESVLDDLGAVAPVEAVYGNTDPYEMRRILSRTRLLELEGYRIGLIHGDGNTGSTPDRAYRAFPDADCIVFGHSHRPYNQNRNGVLLFNPGSPTDKRGLPHYSLGILEVSHEGIAGNIHYFAK